jgi:hypothetical protein
VGPSAACWETRAGWAAGLGPAGFGPAFKLTATVTSVVAPMKNISRWPTVGSGFVASTSFFEAPFPAAISAEVVFSSTFFRKAGSTRSSSLVSSASRVASSLRPHPLDHGTLTTGAWHGARGIRTSSPVGVTPHGKRARAVVCNTPRKGLRIN